jgi:hypothetical protein
MMHRAYRACLHQAAAAAAVGNCSGGDSGGASPRPHFNTHVWRAKRADEEAGFSKAPSSANTRRTHRRLLRIRSLWRLSWRQLSLSTFGRVVVSLVVIGLTFDHSTVHIAPPDDTQRPASIE